MLIGICLNIGHVIAGYSLCWPAPVFQKLQDPERTPLDHPMNDAETTWLAASFHLATLTGQQLETFSFISDDEHEDQLRSNNKSRKRSRCSSSERSEPSPSTSRRKIDEGVQTTSQRANPSSSTSRRKPDEPSSSDRREPLPPSKKIYNSPPTLPAKNKKIRFNPISQTMKPSMKDLFGSDSEEDNASTAPEDTRKGSQVSGFLSNVIGRKFTLMICAAVIFGSNVLMLVAANFATLIVGRVLLGLGVGGIMSCDLVYIGEIASSHLRGIILTSTAVLHNIGGLLVFSVGPYVSYSIVQYILIVLTISHISGLLYIPESPVYHVIKGNEQDARDALHYLGRSKDIDSELKTMIENSKERTLNAEINKTRPILPKWRWLDVFRRRRNRRALAITGFLMVVQEGAGVICILSFATSIFEKARSSVNPNVSTIILGVTQVCGVVIAPLLVEKFGRKALLIFSTIVCALCTAVLAVHFYLELIDHPIQASIRWLPLASLIVFLLGYNSGLGVIPNVLVGEMFSPDARSVGSSIAIGVCCVTAFVTSLTYGFIIMAIGSHIVFTLFTVINVLGCIVTVTSIPETKGMSLTEIEAMLAR